MADAFSPGKTNPILRLALSFIHEFGGKTYESKRKKDDHYSDTEIILQELQEHHHEIICQREDIVVLKNMGVHRSA